MNQATTNNFIYTNSERSSKSKRVYDFEIDDFDSRVELDEAERPDSYFTAIEDYTNDATSYFSFNE